MTTDEEQTATILILKHGSMMAAYARWLLITDGTVEFSQTEIKVLLDWRCKYSEDNPGMQVSPAMLTNFRNRYCPEISDVTSKNS